MARNFTAARSGSDFVLKVDGMVFGKLIDCEVAHIFESPDEDLNDLVCRNLAGDMSLREMLDVIKAAYNYRADSEASEAAAEIYAENAWLRAAEYDPEAQDEMYRDDMMGKS